MTENAITDSKATEAQPTIETVRLGDLEENDYNPRKRFDGAAMEDLKNSIENVGLVQPPTVRPGENGNYEVISGSRRLRALKDLFDDDHEITVFVRDVGDEEARWMALAENLDRMDLTPIEEARAYAQHVTISVDGEEMAYDEYIKEANHDDVVIKVPSRDAASVGRLSERINPGPDAIEHRLSLLVLPEPVQNRVENGDLVLRAAETIARLRQIPDTEYRAENMKRLAERYSGSSPDLDELRDSVDGIIDSFEEEQDRKEARIERLEDLVDEREGDLRVELKKASNAFAEATDGHLKVDNGDDLDGLAQSAVDQLGERINALGTGSIDELDDRQAEATKEKERLQRNLQVIQDEALDRCPFCTSGVHAETIQDKIDALEAEIESIREEKSGINETREVLREIRSDLRQSLTYYTDAVDELETAHAEVS